MICPKCRNEATLGARICKHCGSEIVYAYKKCPNGHNYSAELEECPYCPKVNKLSNVSYKSDVLKSFNTDQTQNDELTKLGVTGIGSDPEKTIILEPDKDKKGDSKKLIGWLVTFDLNDEGMDYKVHTGRIKIGRGTNNEIRLNHSTISEEHAIIFAKDSNSVMLQDLFSSNGVFLNGEKIEKASIKDGDRVTLGKITLIAKII